MALGGEAQGGDGGGLSRTERPFHQSYRQIGGGTVIQQALGDSLQRTGAHEDGQGGFGAGQFMPVGVRRQQVMAFENADFAGHAPVRKRDARGRRGPLKGADAGDHFEGNADLGQGLGFLAAAPEDERIAALEADHAATCRGMLDEQFMNAFLRDAQARSKLPFQPHAKAPPRVRPQADARRGHIGL